ncbi:hypothetical protein MKEN_00151200 [Mycena kentingensis (nom. inval.)]|nr:hypothetical protein MKEN_00151200 [Mycena kentingensis (nom. inval.)]
MLKGTTQRVSTSLACIQIMVGSLNGVANILEMPAIRSLSQATSALIIAVKELHQQTDTCAMLLSEVQSILHIIVLTDPEVFLSSLEFNKSVLAFTETIYKIYAYLSTQHSSGRLSRMFRSKENAQLLANCTAQLKVSMEMFKAWGNSNLILSIDDLHRQTEAQQQALLHKIETLSSTTKTPSLGRQLNTSSSDSFAMLPSMPQIFHGRDKELDVTAQLVSQSPSSHIAILGPGGIGKTTFAAALLHHPLINSTFKSHIFVQCHSAVDHLTLAAELGALLGLRFGQDLTEAVLRKLVKMPATILVLDNIETAWEDQQTRPGVENFLSRLSGVKDLTLIVSILLSAATP